jgi:GDPmannose 4,6-dehydratase
MAKTALITGISGQDGSYLAEYLLNLGYHVWGFARRDPQGMRWIWPIANRIELVYGDLRDPISLEVGLRKAWPDEVYNLAAQVFVPSSWEFPAETVDTNVGGLARILRIVEQEKPDTRVYQASSSEMYGNAPGACNEQTPFSPASPYGVSKLAAHRLCQIYRERGLYVVGGILFNHESPRRGPEMVTRRITLAAASWAKGDRTKLKLGNLQARRDWGFAGDYVKAIHLMLQQKEPKDYTIGTGKSHSVAEFVEQVFGELRQIDGKGDFSGPIEKFVEVDPRFLRTSEIRDLRADASLARKELGWKPTVDFQQLVHMMVTADYAALNTELTSPLFAHSSPPIGGLESRQSRQTAESTLSHQCL